MQIFHNLNVDWLGKRKIFYAVSTSLFLIGVISVIIRGFHFGIDFKGGTEIVMQFQKPVSIDRVRNYVENIGLGNLELKTFGGETGILIRSEAQNIPHSIFPKVVGNINNEIQSIYPGLPFQIVDSSANTVTYALPNPDTTNLLVEKLFTKGFQTSKGSEELNNNRMVVSVSISDWIKDNLKKQMPDNPFKILKEDHVGPKVGNELKVQALLSIFLSLLGILIYLAFRFKFIFAAGAVVALFHDTLITIGLYAALYGIIPGLNLEIDLTVIGAFLTLIGYSVNDTVIVFDRVRESMKIHKTMPVEEVINLSVNKTMSRTILTGSTVLLAVLVLLIFGGEVLRAFAFTLFFGTIIGTYSSIFVASALVVEYVNYSKKKIEF